MDLLWQSALFRYVPAIEFATTQGASLPFSTVPGDLLDSLAFRDWSQIGASKPEFVNSRSSIACSLVKNLLSVEPLGGIARWSIERHRRVVSRGVSVAQSVEDQHFRSRAPKRLRNAAILAWAHFCELDLHAAHKRRNVAGAEERTFCVASHLHLLGDNPAPRMSATPKKHQRAKWLFAGEWLFLFRFLICGWSGPGHTTTRQR